MIPARILIIDPHPATREGVRQFLAADAARWEVCGCESNALQAIAQIAHLQPDLAIVEYEGHGMDGLELAAQLGRLRRTLEVMIYTANTSPYSLQRIFPADVAGAVLKTEPSPNWPSAWKPSGGATDSAPVRSLVSTSGRKKKSRA